jgi:hypothetical protein
MIAQVGNFQNCLLTPPQGLPLMPASDAVFFGHGIVNVNLE